MKNSVKILLPLILLVTGSCISQFLPETNEAKSYLVIEGLLTDQNSAYKVKITRSTQLGSKKPSPPVSGCVVYVSDDKGNKYYFKEKPSASGTYKSDSLIFRGVAGRKYILHITSGSRSYESFPTEMNPVPPIDSLYADIIYKNTYALGESVPGYQVFVNTHDAERKCNYYRWDFTETWEFRLPYAYETIKNRICWKTAYSKNIFVKNTSALIEDKVAKFPLNFITTETDRLTVKYSLLLTQYSLNQDEFNYWEKLQRMTENVGGLYDIVPMSIESNIYCLNYPEEKVLGFFSVSSVASKRLFIIKSALRDFPNFYQSCPVDTVAVGRPIPGLNVYLFIIERLDDMPGSYYVLTDNKACADCSVTGSTVRPPFWNQAKGDAVIISTLK